MIAIIDYGMGNLRSVQKALERTGERVVISHKPEAIEEAQKIVLPGVGAIKPAMDRLYNLEMVDTIKRCIEKNKPFLGICLGYQLLFEKSYEGGHVEGLGILRGEVKKFEALKIPQMGWNQITFKQNDNPLFRDIDDNAYMYFCHSYYVVPKDTDIIATTTQYGIEYASSIRKNNIFGVQFHPEKSQTIGLKILENFTKL